jgi:hypothetical protein
MKALLQDVQLKKQSLKPTVTVGGTTNLSLVMGDSELAKQDETRREYFFQAGVDQWYNKISRYTFESAFIPLQKEEARCIIDYWHNIGSKSNEEIKEIPTELQSLEKKVDEVLQRSFFPKYSAVFVKLSTRSPKDSKTIFRKAEQQFQQRIDLSSGKVKDFPETVSRDNGRLLAFSEEMARANAVTTGKEAITVLLDSWRVAEDLMYALGEDDPEDGIKALVSTGAEVKEKKEFSISLVIRGWDNRIIPKCEFRGFVWNYSLNCIGQYWHSLYYPDLVQIKDKIASDCLKMFDEIKSSLPVPNAMLDLAWLGNDEVILIEVNPLMEGLGSFKGSTGLFDYYEDEAVLTGKVPFEIRVREVEESRSEIISHMSMEWRRVIYGF